MAVEDYVALVAAPRALVRHAQDGFGPQRREPGSDEAPRERQDLDRQRRGTEPSDPFRRVGDHDHPVRRLGDDLLAHQRAARALYDL